MDAKFIDAVKTGKLVRVRLALSNELMLDPRGVTFTEMLRHAESNLSDLYQADDGKIYDNDPTKWDEEFLYDLKNGLDLNFSKEKLDLYETVAKYVLKEKAGLMEQDDTNGSSQQSSVEDSESQDAAEAQISKKQAYMCVTVSCAIVALANLIQMRPGLASLGLAGAVIGGVLLYNESKK